MFSFSSINFVNFFENIFNTIWSRFFVSLIKYFLRKCTGLCELQRICYRTQRGAERCLNIEKCLNNSKSKIITNIREKFNRLSCNGQFSSCNSNEIVVLIEYALEAICMEKNIKPNIHLEFTNGIRICFLQIYGYQNLFFQIEQLRCTTYEDDESGYEKMLKSLWAALKPDMPYKRIGPHWKDIGFQGSDPKTDFRGMGLLGLNNLVYFCSNHSNFARQILLHSNHPSLGYPFAITGINLTHITYILMKTGRLKTHFFNTHFGTLCLDDFHRVYCYVFSLFDQRWLKAKPKDIMEFSYIKQKLIEYLNTKLEDNRTILKFTPPVDDI